MRKQFIFLAKFFLIFAMLQAAILLLNLEVIEKSIASIEAKALGLQSNENFVFVNGEAFSIDANCTGLLSGGIVAAIVFSLRKPEMKKKLLVLFSAALALFLLNIPRIYLVLWTAKEFGAAAAETAHIATWFSTAAFILVFWYFATKKIAKVEDFSQLL